jgi:iron complex transport system permease protein
VTARVMFLLLVTAIVVAACAGPAGWRAPWRWDAIVLELRAPRVVLAACVGAALAVSGVAMQTLLRNDLAEPYVLGISGGAAAGAVLALALLGAFVGIGAAVGALAATALVRALVRGPFDPVRLLLAGFAVGAVCAAITGLVLVLAPGERLLRTATFWLFGGLGAPRWPIVLVASVGVFAIGAWLFRRAERLDRLTLGDDVAISLGVDVARVRRAVLGAAIALTAITVALAGLIGFVGLIAPHAARRWVGAAVRDHLPVAALGGALLLVGADLLARTAVAPREVPVGLVTALVGGPFFLWQLQREVA